MRLRSRSGKATEQTGQRLRHLGWATLIALLLQLTGILVIGDKGLRYTQYRLESVEASGEIAFVGATQDLADPAYPERRTELANLIGELDRAGAKAIYVDLAFQQSGSPAADRTLHEALASASGRAFLVDQLTTGIDGEDSLQSSAPSIAEGIESVGSDLYTDFFGFVWYMPYTISVDDRQLPSLAAHINGAASAGEKLFPVSYYFDLGSIPVRRFEALIREPAQLRDLAGKTVVIGLIDPPNAAKRNLPGLPGVSPSLIHIYAAETLLAGHTSEIGGITALGVAAALLFAIAFLARRRFRYAGYALVCLAIPLAFHVSAQMTTRMAGASVLALLLVFAAMRAREAWKRNLRLVDEDTGLPTFAALEGENAVADTVPAIIVAKIHRFEDVRRTLPRHLHSEYVLRIIARLKAATQDAAIYLGPGQQIAWTMHEKEPALLKEHLEGLRALFASPLMVGNTQIDVGITFGVDITPSPNVARRVASAVAAAERTNETFEPIAIADGASEEDLIWNISLQARIDAALANGEIFLVYQPKINVQTGELIGVEALVRWLDPVRGQIPPDHFIRQCENAGRMSHLTRHVLLEGCNAGVAFTRLGMRVPVAINISATLLHERTIVRMVRDVLAETAYDPRLLSLEITETYRISNLERACEILTELKSLGLAISMDDFGVGAASMEALLRLPFSELKIDRLFIAGITHDPKALGIVRHVLALGEELRITVVAEGVEDAQTLNLLRDSGCRVAQGFGIARPTSFDEVVRFQTLAGKSLNKNGLNFTNKVG